MSATEVQLRFAAELALFLVALAGLGSTFLRADLLVQRTSARAGVALGFAGLGAAAFASGSIIVDDPTEAVVVGSRVAGIVFLLLASRWWHTHRRGRALLLLGLLALAGAEAALLRDAPGSEVDILRGFGA